MFYAKGSLGFCVTGVSNLNPKAHSIENQRDKLNVKSCLKVITAVISSNLMCVTAVVTMNLKGFLLLSYLSVFHSRSQPYSQHEKNILWLLTVFSNSWSDEDGDRAAI